jgi:hypothetical protein
MHVARGGTRPDRHGQELHAQSRTANDPFELPELLDEHIPNGRRRRVSVIRPIGLSGVAHVHRVSVPCRPCPRAASIPMQCAGMPRCWQKSQKRLDHTTGPNPGLFATPDALDDGHGEPMGKNPRKPLGAGWSTSYAVLCLRKSSWTSPRRQRPGGRQVGRLTGSMTCYGPHHLERNPQLSRQRHSR